MNEKRTQKIIEYLLQTQENTQAFVVPMTGFIYKGWIITPHGVLSFAVSPAEYIKKEIATRIIKFHVPAGRLIEKPLLELYKNWSEHELWKGRTFEKQMVKRWVTTKLVEAADTT